MTIKLKYFINTICSKAYWQYVLFSKAGLESVLGIFGLIYLIVEALDFFNIYTQDKYASFAFFIFLFISIVISVLVKRPISSISIELSKYDILIEVRIGDIFDASGAVMISSNTKFESDVAGGKIAVDSLQGQFTAKYFTGNQNELISKITDELNKLNRTSPYPIGTTIPITTHGKTFYFTAMANLNEQGNAYTTTDNVKSSLNGLWTYVRESGELQELAVPVIGTGRGRLQISRKKMIALIAESFVKESEHSKFTDKLIIVIRSEDANKFGVNLYDIKDNLNQVLLS